MKINKYIVMKSDESGDLLLWRSNVIYKGHKAIAISQITELKKLYPTAKVYKLVEIKI